MRTKHNAWMGGITAYQWLVMFIAGGAWLCDTVDQRLFSLSRIPALVDLMNAPAADSEVQAYGKMVTAVFLVGWGTGGIVMGVLGDRFGHARILSIAILFYSLGTAATAFSPTAAVFLILRFVTGLGIGGVFGLAAALIAESFSGQARVAMLAALQILSTLGNITAVLIKMSVDKLAAIGVIDPMMIWRVLFGIGGLPFLLGIIGLMRLHEPSSWQLLRREAALPAGILGPFRELLSDPGERRNLWIGSLIASAGVVGLWSVGEYATDLQDAVFFEHFRLLAGVAAAPGLTAAAKNQAYLLQMIGGCVGMVIFAFAANRMGRRPVFCVAFALAFILTVLTYARLETPADSYWMIPLMGAAQFSVFAGFSIYLPELFSARVRATGISFCYNVGRFAAAAGSLVSAALSTQVFSSYPSPLPLRYSAILVSTIFLVGVVAALVGPETGRVRPRLNQLQEREY